MSQQSTTHSFEEYPNIMVKKHLPSHLVIPLVDCAVIYGGQGSVQTAIASGAPVVGYPLQGEQYFNLKIIERHGAGICLPLNAIRKRKFRTAVEKVLGDATFKTNMQRLQSYQACCDGAENAATILQEMIQDCSPGNGSRGTPVL